MKYELGEVRFSKEILDHPDYLNLLDEFREELHKYFGFDPPFGIHNQKDKGFQIIKNGFKSKLNKLERNFKIDKILNN